MQQHPLAVCLCMALLATSPCFAQDANPEDEPLEDPAPLTAPAPSTPAQPDTPNPPDTPAQTPSPAAAPAASTAASTSTQTVPRSEFDALKAQQAETQRQLEELRALLRPATAGGTQGTQGTQGTGGAGSTTPEPPEAPETTVSGNRNYLLLPDISLILQAKGLASSDRRSEDRSRLNLSEAELAIQGYVYPGVKADAFIVGAPAEDEPFGLEEGFLTFQGVRRGLNINVGRKFTPFGRTGEQHNHSWLYPRQLLPIQNLVAGEALVGDGVGLNYLVPNTGKYFLRASLGAWSGQGTETLFNRADTTDPFFGGIGSGSGAGYTRRFYTGRLWAGRSFGQDNEVELGASRAYGRSEIFDQDENPSQGGVHLTGFDATFRRFMPRGRRLLVRGEYFRHTPNGGLPTRRADGYYGLANFRFSPFADIGVLYENSGFPQAPGLREKAYSLIFTKQLTEQFYVRLMGTHGDRPGDRSYNELRLQFTAGLGPHTHTLE